MWAIRTDLFWTIPLALLSFSNHATAASTTQPTATIGIGQIRGVQTLLPNAAAPVNKFLGVPFALPPTRFMPPEPAVPLTQILDTTEWMPSCPQDFPGPALLAFIPESIFNVPTPKEDEDCLYLNVYAPSTPPPPEGFPVMFWLFGGGFSSGSASLPFYDGSAFAAYQDVIVVAPNYRTNVFGFPNSPELADDEQNAGLQDQRLALQWVQDNIHSFGGSKDRVTIFGQSAGAWSVDSLLLAYNNENAPFQAAILESGQTTIKPTNQTAPDRTQTWDKLVKKLGCSDATSQMACVQQAPWYLVKAATASGFLTFIPVVDHSTWFSAEEIASKKASGDFAKVPIMSGTLTQEGRAIALGQFNLESFMKRALSDAPYLLDSVLGIYNQTQYGDDGYLQSSAAITELVFTCPQSLYMQQMAGFGIPTWGYLYNASFPNTHFSNTSGVWHSSEINVVFQTYPDGPVNKRSLIPWGLLRSILPSTSSQRDLSEYLNKAWADFAKDPQAGPGWDAYNGQSNGSLRLFQEDPSDAGYIGFSELTQNCELLKPVYCGFSPSPLVC